MYRSPAHSSRASGYLMLLFLLWGAFYVSGCTDTPSDPGFDTVPPMEDAEIEMATDPDLTAALIEDVTSSMSTNMTSVAALEISTAENLFGQAQVELTQGDFERVRSLGDQARDALGRALAQGRDRSSLDDFIDRIRDIRRQLAAGDTDDFDRPSDLKTEIDRLLDEAIAALDRGDLETAGKRAIDAHRRADRSRVRRHDGDPEKGARLAVAMADKAVELANGLLDGTEISERRQHLLDTAARMAAWSAEAYENGHEPSHTRRKSKSPLPWRTASRKLGWLDPMSNPQSLYRHRRRGRSGRGRWIGRKRSPAHRAGSGSSRLHTELLNSRARGSSAVQQCIYEPKVWRPSFEPDRSREYKRRVRRVIREDHVAYGVRQREDVEGLRPRAAPNRKPEEAKASALHGFRECLNPLLDIDPSQRSGGRKALPYNNRTHDG